MAKSNKHRILRQVFELHAVSRAAMQDFQETVARPFRAQELPELEAMLDQVSEPDETMRLERLELDLGEFSGANWQTHFRSRLLGRLRDSLERARKRQPTKDTDRERATLSTKDAPLRQLMFFLVHGRLPWWGGNPDRDWTEELKRTLAANQWRALGDLLQANTNARRRLVFTASDGFLSSLIGALTGLRETERVLAVLRPDRRSSPLLADAWRERFWLALMNVAFASDPLQRSKRRRDLIRMLSASLGGSDELEAQCGRDDGLGAEPPFGAELESSVDQLPQPWKDWLTEAMRGPEQSVNERVSDDQRAQSRTVTRPSSPEPRVKGEAIDRSLVQSTERDSTGAEIAHREMPPATFLQTENDRDLSPRADLNETIYLTGAGAVILHPFLEELFRSLKLLEGNGFYDRQARHRAVHLVGYLTFGTQEMPEYELLLPKLLCNHPWQEPLPPHELEKSELGSCSELLDTVLKHWQALKSRSPDWLRARFMIRDGKLERVDEGWKLTIERRPQDVLLARLPWGLGVIRLPWTPGNIYVHWAE